LDRIEDESGKPTADAVLKTLRAISKWVQQRDESSLECNGATVLQGPTHEALFQAKLKEYEIRFRVVKSMRRSLR
jgi:hypothetical protein